MPTSARNRRARQFQGNESAPLLSPRGAADIAPYENLRNVHSRNRRGVSVLIADNRTLFAHNIMCDCVPWKTGFYAGDAGVCVSAVKAIRSGNCGRNTAASMNMQREFPLRIPVILFR